MENKFIRKSAGQQWLVYHIKFLASVWLSLWIVWLLTAPIVRGVPVADIKLMMAFLPTWYVDFIIHAYQHPLNGITGITLFCGSLGILKDFTKQL